MSTFDYRARVETSRELHAIDFEVRVNFDRRKAKAAADLADRQRWANGSLDNVQRSAA